jgi:YARHG domain
MLLPTLAVALVVSAADAGSAARPLEYDRPIAQADLEGRTLRELTLMRNVIFARAGQVFRKEWLNTYFAAQPWYRPSGFDPKKVSKQGHANARAIAAFELKLPRAELAKKLEAALAKPMDSATPEGVARQVEVQLLALATGRPLPVEVFTKEASMLQRDPFNDPSMLKAPLDVGMLKDFSRRDLRILRNTVFARYGRPFKTNSMRTWFSRMEWYRENPKYSDKQLSKVDLENIKLIRSVEDSIGGPETEEEVSGESELDSSTEDFAGA